MAGAAEAAAEGGQALVLITEWPEIVGADWEAIASPVRPSKFLIDGRNALDPSRMNRLGFEYTGVGQGDTSQPDILGSGVVDTAIMPAVESGASDSVRGCVPMV